VDIRCVYRGKAAFHICTILFHGMEEVVGSIPTRSTIFNYLQTLRI